MNPNSFKIELQEFLSTTGISQNQLSKEARVPQSQISDWNKGKMKRFGKNAKRVLNVIENYRLSDEAKLPEDLQQVVRDFYGGKQENCELLKRLITSLKPIIAK